MKKRILTLLLALLVLLSACGAPALGEPIATGGDQSIQGQPDPSQGASQPARDPDPSEQGALPQPSQPSEEPSTPAQDDPGEQPGQTDSQNQPGQTDSQNQPEQTDPPRQPEPTDPPRQPDPTDPPRQPDPTDPPKQELSGEAAIVAAAYALGSGEALPGTHTLSGIITDVVTDYSSRYGNITVMLEVRDCQGQPIQCFRLEGSGVEHLQRGDEITVSGRLMNYRGTVEFDEGCRLVSYQLSHPVDQPQQQPQPDQSGPNDDSKAAVALYIHENGCLPDFYLTKDQARSLYGWTGGPLDKLAPGLCIGGDTFSNYQRVLPSAPGRRWTECDIDTIGANARGARRIVFSNDGLVYYTGDHYETFELLYGEP